MESATLCKCMACRPDVLADKPHPRFLRKILKGATYSPVFTVFAFHLPKDLHTASHQFDFKRYIVLKEKESKVFRSLKFKFIKLKYVSFFLLSATVGSSYEGYSNRCIYLLRSSKRLTHM